MKPDGELSNEHTHLPVKMSSCGSSRTPTPAELMCIQLSDSMKDYLGMFFEASVKASLCLQFEDNKKLKHTGSL